MQATLSQHRQLTNCFFFCLVVSRYTCVDHLAGTMEGEEPKKVMLGRPGNNVKVGIVGVPNVGKSRWVVHCSAPVASSLSSGVDRVRVGRSLSTNPPRTRPLSFSFGEVRVGRVPVRRGDDERLFRCVVLELRSLRLGLFVFSPVLGRWPAAKHGRVCLVCSHDSSSTPQKLHRHALAFSRDRPRHFPTIMYINEVRLSRPKSPRAKPTSLHNLDHSVRPS